ncbi:MAG TPA: DUF3089 domain-containing protein [Caulobacteraceae bacterium]|jgi:hypothetical protein
MTFAKLAALILGATALFGGASACAQAVAMPTPPSAPQPKNNYADPKTWLCLPGRADDVCGRSDQDATVVSADGSTTVEKFHADPNAPIDCFYVYPTVSIDPGGNATMAIENAEVRVVNQQFARFASVCRPFAPVYRQVTLTALRANLGGHPMAVDRVLPYDDVKDAWDYYLAHENHGRGVVLIGHSQGSLVLAELVKREIDGKPVQNRLLSVILAGYYLQVPVGKDVGGDFKAIPLCKAVGQTQCAINFASFRADNPPPANTLFGASKGPGLEAACVNPSALGGGSGALHAYLGAGGESVVADGVAHGAWTNPATPITTPFVEVPGLLTGECRNQGGHNYLAVTLHPTPDGHRTNTITGDVVIAGKVRPEWGLHIVDMNLTMGDLVDVVRAQGQTYLAHKP